MFAVTLSVPVSLSQREIACEHHEPNHTGNHPYFRAHLFSPFRRRGCCSQTSERTGYHKWLIDKDVSCFDLAFRTGVPAPRVGVQEKPWPLPRKVVTVPRNIRADHLSGKRVNQASIRWVSKPRQCRAITKTGCFHVVTTCFSSDQSTLRNILEIALESSTE